ncbi:hypothetical protein [Sporocytophaga myxococcoides]|uniref:hypothetical protein n=1 Tax=Sporocytophaga myxococcoides TaxID=153721 RepID=UPI00048F3C27|nr:hypothetical protein [Sporocytophaga myxococcoides]
MIDKSMINKLAVITMLAGLFGMLFCFPFLWSGRMEDLVGAGFPFVAGSILFGSGLLTLGLFNRDKNK